jgi:CO/xanthine dehydrogenase FAD-binding subunit
MGSGRRWAVSTPLAVVASDGTVPQALREAAGLDQYETIGGALAMASAQAVTTALLALEAEVVVSADADEERQPLTELLTVAGSVQAEAGAAVSAVMIGDASDDGSERSAYREGVGCGVAVRASTLDGSIEAVTIAMWGAASHPIRARQVEGTLRGRRVSASLLDAAVATLRSEVQPRGQGRVIDEAALAEIERTGAEALRAVFGSVIASMGPETQ